MIEEYISNKEYENYYSNLNSLRYRIAKNIPINPGMRVIDVATGSAFFAIEVARLHPDVEITGIDIAESDIRNAKKNIKREGLKDRIRVLKMDATDMKFTSGEFDLAINFTGLEDIHMTRGKAGVKRTFIEVCRVTKPHSHFYFVIMPPEEMETEAQRIEVALFSYICDATWLSMREYEDMLNVTGFKLINKKSYYTGKILTAGQAKAEIRYACKNDPRIYGIVTPTFKEIWNKFGESIEKNGLGHYSKVVLLTARKI